MTKPPILLDVAGLSLSIGKKKLLHEVVFKILQGKTVALVGESGSGKSLTAKAILGLAENARGTLLFKGENLLTKSSQEMTRIRGKEIAFICQNPMSALNPTRTIGSQLMEGMLWHERLTKKEGLERASYLLNEVGFSDPSKRLSLYPDQLSGGMRQRVVIAMALACKPSLLIADEPTTALDVTTQAQILDLLDKLQQQHNMSILLITHDLGVVARQSQSLYILKEGLIVDEGTPDQIFYTSKNTYTRELCWKRL